MIRKYRIKSQFRFTVFLTMVLLFSIFVSGTLLGFNTTASMTKPIYAQVQVESGDTLWNLAKEFGPADIDTRKIVREICSLNGVDAYSLHPGQVILIPKSL